MSELPDEIKQNIDRNPAIFEAYIMAALVGSHSFFLQHGFKICPIRERIGTRRADFTHNWMNVVYEAVCVYWGGRADVVEEGIVPRTHVDIYLNEASDGGRILDKEIEDIEVGLSNIYSLAEASLLGTIEFVERGVLSRWLGIRLSQEWSRDALADPNIVTPERIAAWHDQLQQIPQDDDDDTIISADEAVQGALNRGDLYGPVSYTHLTQTTNREV